MAEQKIKEFFKGSIVKLQRYCGKSNCHCKNDGPHQITVLSYSIRGRTYMLPLKPEDVERVKHGIDNYRIEKSLLDDKALAGIASLRNEINMRRLQKSCKKKKQQTLNVED